MDYTITCTNTCTIYKPDPELAVKQQTMKGEGYQLSITRSHQTDPADAATDAAADAATDAATDAGAEFGRWLSRQRKARDLTQEELAERLGCSVWAIQKIEVGKRRPSKQLPDLKHLPPLERLSWYEAIRLFIQRAADASADFALTGDNASEVAHICIRLDGLPLAIELAAAWVKVLTPRSILNNLESRLELLDRPLAA